MLPSLKREVSDVSMSSTTGNKVPLHKLRRYSQREVDLSAASQANEARLKKKAGVEKELQNAIAALKRPNARMAVKELIEDAEKRATSSRLTSKILMQLWHINILTAPRSEEPSQKPFCSRSTGHCYPECQKTQGCFRRITTSCSDIQRTTTRSR